MFGNLRGAKRTRNTAVSHATKHMGIMAAVMPLVMAVTMAASLTALPTQASAFGLTDMIASWFSADEDGGDKVAVADGSTIDTWQNHTKTNSTETVGRIWTDKTVQTDEITLTGGTTGGIKVSKEESADFLVGLSALSSTSNLTSVVAKPLDIVLVLDTSESMKDMENGKTKISILKDAAKKFVENVASVSSEETPHQIAVVSFHEVATEEIGLSDVSTNAGEIKSAIDIISQGSSTIPAKGLDKAGDIFRTDGRANAQKIVLFFTDGEPGGWLNPDIGADTEANEAIKSARGLEAQDAKIFSIGVFENADPGNGISADKKDYMNDFMWAVSSSYPNAKEMLDYGRRADVDTQYYYGSQNMSGLSDIFEQIFDSIKTPATSPTHTTEGFGSKSGYITFTDTLGDYMEVKGNEMTVVYANQPFTGKRQSDGSFVFSGEVAGNPVYQDADMANLVVKVAPGENGEGDTVTVKIPAQLIPLRNYTVDTDKDGNTTMSTKEAYPIRIFYSVGLRNDVDDLLAAPDEAMKTYLETNAADGKVSFYSNEWDREAKGAGTVATFTPASTNKFYYFTEKTPLYTDEGCTTRATRDDLDSEDAMYYRNTYYKEQNGQGVEMPGAISIPTSALKGVHEGNWDSDDEGLYMKAATPRLNRTNDFNVAKGEDNDRVSSNATYTATKFISPAWNDDQNGIEVYLGNNGRLSMVLPPAEYTVDGEEELAGTKTLIGRDSLDNENFEFTLIPDDATAQAIDAGKIVPADSGTKAFVEDLTAGERADFHFGNIVIKEAGTYTFVVKETLPPGVDAQNHKKNGVTYDTSEGKVTITAVDTGKGVFDVTVKTDDMDFTNIYEPSPATYDGASAVFGGTKTVKDEQSLFEMAKGQFTFIMRAQSEGNPMPAGDGVTTITGAGGLQEASVKNGAPAANKATYDFGSITFNHEHMAGAAEVGGRPGVLSKTFQYNVWEADTSGIPGIVRDNAAYTVTFVVEEDQNTGEMKVASSTAKRITAGTSGEAGAIVDLDKMDFVNTFDTSQAVGYQNIFKRLVGRAFKKGDAFTFDVKLSAEDGGESLADDELPVISDESLKGGIATLSEVEKDGEGGLSYSVTAKPDTTATGDTFRINTGKIIYHHVGTYTWTVSEAANDKDNGVVNDDVEYTLVVKVTVDEKTGAFKRDLVSINPALATIDEDKTMVFTNTYTAEAAKGVPTGFTFTKSLVGKAWGKDDKFTFKLTAEGEAPMSASDTVTVGKPVEGNSASFNFGAMTFTKAGTYKYTVQETASTNPAIAVVSDEAKVTVTVEDDGEGQLSAAAVVTGSSFTNMYKSGLDYTAAGGLTIVKNLDGRGIADNQFSFNVEPSNDDARAKTGQDAKTVTVGAAQMGENGVAISKAIVFNELTFDQDDAGKTFEYKISEEGEAPNDAYTYDMVTYTVSIAVTDDGQGNMKAVTTIKGSNGSEAAYTYDGTGDSTGAVVIFNNSYKAKGAIPATGKGALKASKQLTGRELVAEEFTFTVKEKGAEGKTVAQGKNDADGKISFSGIEYTTESLKDAVSRRVAEVKQQDGVVTYTLAYTVSEDTAGLAAKGVNADVSSFEITVYVSDAGTGELTVTIDYGKNTDGLLFKNTYDAEAVPLTISGAKLLVGAEGKTLNVPTLKGGEFTFTLKGEAGAPMPAEGGDTTQNDSAGNVTFGPISYSLDNVWPETAAGKVADGDAADTPTAPNGTTRSKTFTYTIEESGTMVGVKNDGDQTVRVTVIDDGNGKLTVKTDAEADSDFTFTNVYDVTATESSPTDGGVAVSKELDGRALKAGEFQFALTEVGGSEPVATAANDAAGAVEFPAISFDRPGTYSYTISEVDNGLGGIGYDHSAHTVRATVTDDGASGLHVAWSMDDDAAEDIVFRNTYTPASTGITLRAAKVLDGRDLKDGEFEFTLTDAKTGEIVATAVNDAAGAVEFDAIEYASAGERAYEIREVTGDVEGVTYDNSVFSVTVDVVDDGEGHLSAADWHYGENGAPVFKNAYKAPAKPVEPTPAPEEPKDKLPVTGDDTLVTVGGVAAAAAALIGGGFVLRKKRD